MESPGPIWRASSTATMAVTGVLMRLFLYAAQRPGVHGLADFLKLLDERRRNPRAEGLITGIRKLTASPFLTFWRGHKVSNHTSVVDDPLMWGFLPLSYVFSPNNLRYGLGSHDICFKNPILGTFFTLGQVLPTYRSHKSPHGGLFQPSIQLSIELLSPPHSHWLHIFPEGRVHQHPTYQMRYFKWGVSRLILETPTQPELVPLFTTGLSDVMHESRGFPRFVPRVGKDVDLHFGGRVPKERFWDVRGEWEGLCRRHRVGVEGRRVEDVEELRTGREAVELRIETTRRVREEVVKLRRSLGFPEEEESAGIVETYKARGMRKDGKLVDGETWEKDI
ncbi:Lyso-phosphatidylcholine acyltransferase [Rhizina undulata]